jgi:signal transduction histidine kinase
MPAEQVARLAHEQEASLRQLLLTGPGGGARDGGPASQAGAQVDLAATVAEVLATTVPATRASYSRPATAVLLPAGTVRETAAAVRAALDNVMRHAGDAAHVFVLVEDEDDSVRITVRDDGTGMTAERPEQAADEGRLGLARSVRGRVQDLGGTVTVTSAPDEGVEVEFVVPR